MIFLILLYIRIAIEKEQDKHYSRSIGAQQMVETCSLHAASLNDKKFQQVLKGKNKDYLIVWLYFLLRLLLIIMQAPIVTMNSTFWGCNNEGQ